MNYICSKTRSTIVFPTTNHGSSSPLCLFCYFIYYKITFKVKIIFSIIFVLKQVNLYFNYKSNIHENRKWLMIFCFWTLCVVIKNKLPVARIGPHEQHGSVSGAHSKTLTLHTHSALTFGLPEPKTLARSLSLSLCIPFLSFRAFHSSLFSSLQWLQSFSEIALPLLGASSL